MKIPLKGRIWARSSTKTDFSKQKIRVTSFPEDPDKGSGVENNCHIQGTMCDFIMLKWVVPQSEKKRLRVGWNPFRNQPVLLEMALGLFGKFMALESPIVDWVGVIVGDHVLHGSCEIRPWVWDAAFLGLKNNWRERPRWVVIRAAPEGNAAGEDGHGS